MIGAGDQDDTPDRENRAGAAASGGRPDAHPPQDALSGAGRSGTRTRSSRNSTLPQPSRGDAAPGGSGPAEQENTAEPATPLRLHASAVSVDGRGLLILGPSGSGKSALALELMARGARLVADDQVELRRDRDTVIATCPPAIRGRIEARFVGLLNADPVDQAEIALILRLDRAETERLPPRRSENLLGVAIPLLHNAATAHFSAAILQYLKAGRSA